ncbi:BRO-N domain-containing protein [Pseudomonas folii]|uniref:Bro-N domain-containing protein n=1 Tax=Pseudomonas folii TaxID=2762593 RepID=A0ABR7AWP6_9PSED|nr:Bro-N domain-containing protein [Pseudomonas folii]MBC3949319.1 Bro-N domain-containing protein [Pseudomonas folii]
MQALQPQPTRSTDCFEPLLFVRHQRMLRALMLEGQGWFCLQDLARLMGKALDQRSTYKLDPDQYRNAWLLASAQWSKQILISESGAYAMLVHHYVPENRALRRWLTHEVMPLLREAPHTQQPSLSMMQWPGKSLCLLQWENEQWIKLRDMPDVLPAPQVWEKPWWRKALDMTRQ